MTTFNELGGEGGKSFKFDKIGDKVSGKLIEVAQRDQTDFEGKVLTWDNGEPRKVWVFTLETELREDEDDDGIRTVWAKGGNYTVDSGSGSAMLPAIKEAVKKSGHNGELEGGDLAVAYTGTGVKTHVAYSAPKLYTAQYLAPVNSVSTDDLFAV